MRPVTPLTAVGVIRAQAAGMEESESPEEAPVVRLGHVAEDSVAANLYVIVDHGVRHRPEMAASMQASVVIRFVEGYAPVRLDFRGDEVIVGDDPDGADRAHDLEIVGRMGDITALIASPLTGGLPKPTTRTGRAALARLADGRVELNGPLALGRRLLRLLAIDEVAVKVPKERGAQRRSEVN
jgi:hypothetical protein